MLFHGQGWGARMDVLLNPYYQRDKATGRITRDEAQELFECLLVKLLERGHLATPNVAGGGPGNSDWIDYTVGGVDSRRLGYAESIYNEYAARNRLSPPPLSERDIIVFRKPYLYWLQFKGVYIGTLTNYREIDKRTYQDIIDNFKFTNNP